MDNPGESVEDFEQAMDYLFAALHSSHIAVREGLVTDPRPKRQQRFGFCVYCGVPVRTQRSPGNHDPITCRVCRDLPRRDPFYADPPDQWANAR